MRDSTGFSFDALEKMLSAEAGRALKASLDPKAAQRYGGSLLFMDRPNKADDNAEHLYRWCRDNTQLKNKLFFVLARGSNDWDRLTKDGFTLLAYKSHQHLQALFLANWLISSHIGKVVLAPAGIAAFWLCKFKFAFLQHGIIKHDISDWLNRYSIHLFVTSAQREYDSIVGGGYKFTDEETVLTGLPRHDALLQRARSAHPGRCVLFCPTWRMHLQQTDEAFQHSDFLTAWNALLGDPGLNQAALKNNTRLLFLPHPQLDAFLHNFTPGPAFSVVEWNKLKSVQELLVRTAMLVTDYSSIAMDFALLNRPLLYYQFTEIPSMFQAHLTKRGYFQYETDGFGPVAHTVTEATRLIAASMDKDFMQNPLYADRVTNFFTLRDGQNCRRVWAEILRRS